LLASSNHQPLGKVLSAIVLNPQGMALAAKIMVPQKMQDNQFTESLLPAISTSIRANNQAD
jgi:hypothetical protein